MKWDIIPQEKQEPSFQRWCKGARGLGKDLDYSCLDTIEIQTQTTDYVNKLAAVAAISILTEDIATYRKPLTWWDAVKERFFPSWVLSITPVIYDTIDIKALYPYAKYKEGSGIIWKTIRNPCIS